jgi:hypothetical protein
MTVAAVYAVVTYVVLVAELDGLLARRISLRVIGGLGQLVHKPQEECQEEDRPEYSHPGEDVRAPMKDLAHCSPGSDVEVDTRCPDGVLRGRKAGCAQRALVEGLRREFALEDRKRVPIAGFCSISPIDLSTVT